jgi:leader peptidase (prepilin peptidase)/N-methyltransferase
MVISGSATALLAAFLVSLPVGWLLSLIARREAAVPASMTPAMVIAAAAMGIWAATVTPPVFVLAATLLLGWTLLLLGAVDFLALRLPDIMTLTLGGIGLLLSLWFSDHDPVGHLVGAALGFLLLYAVRILYRYARQREGLGLGDAKLAAAAGAWLGWQALPTFLLIACAVGLLWIAVATALRGKAAAYDKIPFGVPLCLSFWLVWLYGVPDFSGII